MRKVLFLLCAGLGAALAACSTMPPAWLGTDGGGDAGEGGDTDADADSDADGDADADSDSDADADADGDTDADTEVEPNPLIGMVFVQSGGVGLASYHFDAVDDIYINYSAAPSSWYLDNYQPFPDEKAFIDTSFDLELRAFYGTIDWSYPEATTADGAERWVYEMLFSADYQTISGGGIRMYSPSDAFLGEYAFGVDLFYEAL